MLLLNMGDFMFCNLFKSKKSEAKKLESIWNGLKALYKVEELSDDAKKDIEDVINNLKLQGFKVNYSFENKENGCKITIDID